MTYKLTHTTSVIRIADGACIPADPNNSDYRNYLSWVANSNVASPADPVPTVPQSVTALQGLLAIDQGGLSSAYESWANDPARTFAQKAFINKAQTWKRDDPTLSAAATSLGLTEAQVDGLFALAATL